MWIKISMVIGVPCMVIGMVRYLIFIEVDTDEVQEKAQTVCIGKCQKLGIEVDREQVMKANKLYLDNCLGARDDAIGMQYLIPGWKFNNKRPCLVR